MDVPINYYAILACGIANMILGFIWYGPLFGKPWSRLMGWGDMTPEKMAEMQKSARPAYVVTFVGALLMAYVLAHGLVFGNAYLGMSGVSAGLMGAFWFWLGFVVPVTIGTVFWDKKPWTLWFINAGYYLVALCMMATIISLWV